jgi:hypothetical protein
MNNAVAGLTAEQAKWVPKNAQGKLDPNANHSVGMLAYHLVFWNENALARLRGEKPANPHNKTLWREILREGLQPEPAEPAVGLRSARPSL